MWLFGKKKEKEREASPQDLQVREFARKFLPEEMDLVAVTGPEGVSADRKEGEALWTLTTPLTAWMDEDDGVVSTRPALLQILADDRLREYLRHQLPANFIIKARVRPGVDGDAFQLVGMPEPGFDPELKAILNEQVKPVTLEAEGIGTFTLIRSANWFATQIDWVGQSVQLTINNGEGQEEALCVARTLLSDPEGWDARLRSFAADRLLEAINDRMEEEPVTREELLESLTAESVQVEEEGAFAVWYAGDVLFGMAVQVTGTVDGGPADAQLEE